MSDSIVRLLEELPASNMTTRALDAIDFLVPGTWKNIVSFSEMIQEETGESDEGLIQAVGEKAISLYADRSTGYQRAISLYQMVDTAATTAGLLAFTNKLGSDVGWLSFLEKVTPKSETVQAIDAAAKLALEIAAFASTQGIPGDGVLEFMSSVTNAAKEDRVRLAAWAMYDGVLPLGPEFINRAIETVENGANYLADAPLYTSIKDLLPGGSEGDHRSHFVRILQEARGFTSSFTGHPEASQEGLLHRVKGFVDGIEGKLDYAAAVVDMSTNIFEHTGIQTVARRCIRRAYAEL